MNLIHSMKMAAILNHIQGKWVTNFRLLFDATAMITTWDNQIWHVVKATAKLNQTKPTSYKGLNSIIPLSIVLKLNC